MTVYLETVDITYEAAYFEWEYREGFPTMFWSTPEQLTTTVETNEDYILGIF